MTAREFVEVFAHAARDSRTGLRCLEGRDAAELAAPERVAVVGAIEGHDGCRVPAGRSAARTAGHAHGAFDGRGAVVGEKHASHLPARQQIDELLRQQGRVLNAKSPETTLCATPELLDDRRIDHRMIVPVDIRPDRGIPSRYFRDHADPAGHGHSRFQSSPAHAPPPSTPASA